MITHDGITYFDGREWKDVPRCEPGDSGVVCVSCGVPYTTTGYFAICPDCKRLYDLCKLLGQEPIALAPQVIKLIDKAFSEINPDIVECLFNLLRVVRARCTGDLSYINKGSQG